MPVHVNSKNDLCNLEIVKVRNFISNELLYDNAAKMNISVLSVTASMRASKACACMAKICHVLSVY